MYGPFGYVVIATLKSWIEAGTVSSKRTRMYNILFRIENQDSKAITQLMIIEVDIFRLESVLVTTFTGFMGLHRQKLCVQEPPIRC